MNKPLNPWKLTGYKAGQNVACKIMGKEPGGYVVVIPKDNLPGFLPSDANFRIGEEVLAQFVCVDKNRVLLSSRFAPGQAPKAAPQNRWDVNKPEAHVPHPTTESEAAFGIWSAQAAPERLHLKRATDLILPPINGEKPKVMKIADYDLEWLITDLEGGMRTGCMKVASAERISRSAVLLYRGRAVGCIYGSKTMNDTHPTEPSLGMMMADLELPQTEVMIYDLPEEVTLAMSALFLGYPVQRSDDLDAKSYMDYLCGWFAEKKQTACLAFSLPSTAATLLAFIHAGQFVGSFYVEDQKFSRERQFVYDLLAADAKAGVEASILPPEMTSQAVRFGFSLSMARKNKLG